MLQLTCVCALSASCSVISTQLPQPSSLPRSHSWLCTALLHSLDYPSHHNPLTDTNTHQTHRHTDTPSGRIDHVHAATLQSDPHFHRCCTSPLPCTVMDFSATPAKRTRSAQRSSGTTAAPAPVGESDNAVSQQQRRSQRQRGQQTAQPQLDDEAVRGDEQMSSAAASKSAMQLRTRRSSSMLSPSINQQGVDAESSCDESDASERSELDESTATNADTSTTTESSSSSSNSRRTVSKAEQKQIDKWKAVQAAATEVTNWIAQQLQEHHIDSEQQTRALTAVQKPIDEMLQQATQQQVYSFDMVEPLTLKGLLMSAIGVDADRLEWKGAIRDLCHKVVNEGRKYAKLMTPATPFKRPTTAQLKQLDDAGGQSSDSDMSLFKHFKPLIAMLTPADLCKLRSVNQHWRQVVNSFSEWLAALLMPPFLDDVPEYAWRHRPTGEKVLKTVADIPGGSLSAVRTLVLGRSDFYITQIETRTLLWALRQCAPNIERVAIMDLHRDLSIQLPILLSFPRLHSFSLYQTRSLWQVKYEEHEGRIAPRPKLPSEPAAEPTAELAGTAVDGDTEKAPKLADKQWQQLKQKCTVWFSHTTGGGPKAAKAAASNVCTHITLAL